MPLDEVLDMTYRTAERLYRHKVPEAWLRTTSLRADDGEA
jgi:hypothetical protein